MEQDEEGALKARPLSREAKKGVLATDSPCQLSYERIHLFLFPDRSGWAVAGMDLDLIGQGEELLFDPFDQRFVIAMGEVGSADAPLKEDITSDELLSGLIVKHDMPRSVTGDQKHIQFCIPEAKLFAFLDVMIRTRRFLKPEAINGCVFFHPVHQDLFVLVHFGLEPVGVANEVRPQDVVDMAMGLHQFHGFQPLIGDSVLERFLFGPFIASRVDDEAFLAVLIHKDVSVLHERVEGEGSDLHS